MPQIPNFLNEEYVSNTIFNTGFAQLEAATQTLASGEVFFRPGVVNPTSLTFTTTGGLTVTVTPANATANPSSPFKCLFGSGAYTDAHGITNGTDSDVYSVNFASLVPGSGSVVAYVVAQYQQVLENALVVTGPPPGHPDYSSTFVPYLGYTTNQDSLNIFATTTVPDNIVSIELARVTLNAGQTVITSGQIVTSNQVLAAVIVGAVSLNGDVTGGATNNFISNLQGKSVSVPNPPTNSVLTFNGSQWVASVAGGSFPPTGPAGGDLALTYPNPQVNQSSNATFTAKNVQANGNITLTGNVSGTGSLTMTGTLGGAFGAALNQAVMLGQLVGAVTGSGVGTFSRSIQIPIFDTTSSSFISVIIQFGFFSWFGLTPTQVQNKPFTLNYPLTFPTACLWAVPQLGTNKVTTPGSINATALELETVTPLGSAPAALPTNQLTVYADWDSSSANIIVANNSNNGGLTGFYWMAVGL